jgi:uncharacterized iron-regulated membrane protein
MRLKNTIRVVHLWLGLTSGLVVFIVASTGCLYAFEEELRTVIHKDVYFTSTVQEQRVSLQSIIDGARNEKQKIKNIRVFNDAQRTIQINLKNNTSLFFDPYTGKQLGSINNETEFFAVVQKIHRTLYLGDFGKAITGASCLIFFVMIVSGIVLWWPANKRMFKQKFCIHREAGPARFNYDLHSVLGFYASWIIIFTVLTGLIWSYEWMEDGMYSLTGSKKEMLKVKSLSKDSTITAPVDLMLAASLSQTTNSSEQFIMLPEDSKGSVKINVRCKKAGLFTEQYQFFFDSHSGELLKSKPFENNSLGDKLKATNYNIHTGKVLGFAGQMMVFFASLISASLPVTGFLLWRRRRKAKR